MHLPELPKCLLPSFAFMSSRRPFHRLLDPSSTATTVPPANLNSYPPHHQRVRADSACRPWGVRAEGGGCRVQTSRWGYDDHAEPPSDDSGHRLLDGPKDVRQHAPLALFRRSPKPRIGLHIRGVQRDRHRGQRLAFVGHPPDRYLGARVPLPLLVLALLAQSNAMLCVWPSSRAWSP